jgi:hypothetical protein
MARFRPALVVAAVTAVLIVALLPALHSDHRSGSIERSAAIVGTATTTLTSPNAPARVPGSSFPPASLLFGGVMALFVTRFTFTALVGRHGGRFGDVGDSWRALLRGAPPILR